MITEDYVSFETAKLLKEKGFGGGCFSMYVTPKPHSGMGNPNEAKIAPHGRDSRDSYYYKGYKYQCEAPTLQMAIKWLREGHDIYIMIDKDFLTENGWHYVIVTKQDWNDNVNDGLIQQESNNYTYEFACEAAIRYCLKNLI